MWRPRRFHLCLNVNERSRSPSILYRVFVKRPLMPADATFDRESAYILEHVLEIAVDIG
jgi:hypothetical protein